MICKSDQYNHHIGISFCYKAIFFYHAKALFFFYYQSSITRLNLPKGSQSKPSFQSSKRILRDRRILVGAWKVERNPRLYLLHTLRNEVCDCSTLQVFFKVSKGDPGPDTTASAKQTSESSNAASRHGSPQRLNAEAACHVGIRAAQLIIIITTIELRSRCRKLARFLCE